MKYGLCADLHFHNWAMFSKPLSNGMNSRLDGMLKEFRRLCDETRKQGGKRVYVAGDVFHVRGSVKTSVLNPVVSAFLEAARVNDLEIRIMPGNHDLEGSETDWLGNSTIAMADGDDDNPYVRIVNSPVAFDDDKVAVVPWQNTREGLKKAIWDLLKEMDACKEDPAEYDLHLHTGINGVIIGMPEHGWAPEDLATFGFKRVFAGHYHNHKVFTLPVPGTMADETQIVSIGALTHQTWGDVGSTAGWMIVDDDGFEQIESKTPKFMDFDDSYDIDDYEGNYVRVRGIHLEESEIRDLKQGLEDAGVLGVVVHAVAKSKTVTRGGKSAGKAVKMEESISEWIEASDDIEDTDVKAVEVAAYDVLSAARSL